MSIDPVEVVADLQATVDYLREITDRSDTVDFDDAVAIQDELVRVKAAAATAIGMVDQAMLKRLEAAPRAVSGRVFARVKNYVERHDHDVIARTAYEQAVRAAVDPETGEIDQKKAIQAGIEFMRSAYLSASSKAKVTPLKAAGLKKSDYEDKELKGWKLSVTETDPEAAAERREA